MDFYEKRCLDCDKIINWDGSLKYCRKHYAERAFVEQTGLDVDCLPDSLPLEDFIDEQGYLDYDGISTW